MADQTSEAAELNAQLNPFKAQRRWPPDFSKMDPKHQFRLERRYRRRLLAASQFPRWNKAIKLVQLGACSSIAIYGLLYMDWGNTGKPLNGPRTWIQERVDNLWRMTTTQQARPYLGRIAEKGQAEAVKKPK